MQNGITRPHDGGGRLQKTPVSYSEEIYGDRSLRDLPPHTERMPRECLLVMVAGFSISLGRYAELDSFRLSVAGWSERRDMPAKSPAPDGTAYRLTMICIIKHIASENVDSRRDPSAQFHSRARK
jgi:hypothetical protein